MYKLIKDNVVATSDGIAYFYKLRQYNTNLTKTNDSSLNQVKKIINKLELPGELIFVPTNFDIRNIDDKYDPLINELDSEDDYLLASQLKEETKNEIAKTVKLKQSLYLVLKSTKVNFEKKKLLHLFKADEIPKFSKSDLKYIDKLNNQYIKVIKECNLNDNPKITANETYSLLNYLFVPKYNQVDDYIVEVENEQLKYCIENKSGLTNNKFVKFSQVTKLPDEAKGKFRFVDEIQRLRYAVDIVIKFEVDSDSKKVKKKLSQNKHAMRGANERRKKYLSETSSELEANQNLAAKQKARYETSLESIINHQINIRINANEIYEKTNKDGEVEIIDGREELQNRYITVKQIFARNKIEVASSLGKQEKLMNNFIPTKITTSENLHKVGDDFFSNYNLLSTTTLGNENLEESIVKFYTYPKKYPVFVDSYAMLKKGVNVNATSPVSIFIGSTGSGKSQLANNDIMTNIILNGANELIIDPKGDRIDFIKNLKLDGVDPTTIGNEFIIGKNLKYKGALDPFLQNLDLNDLALELASFIKLLLKLDGREIEFQANKVNNYLRGYYESTSEKMSMIGFMDYLKDTDQIFYETLKGYEEYRYANLFYSTGKTTAITFDKKLTIIILEAINTSSDLTGIEPTLFNLALDKIEAIVKDFMRSQKQNKFGVTLEEIGYFKKQTGSKLDNEMSRLIRSFGGQLRLISQNFTDIDREIITQIGSMYFGMGMSSSEITSISKEIRIEEDKLKLLRGSNDDESIKEEDKYIFLYVDNNNRRGFIRQEFLPMFKKSFETKKESEEKLNA